MLEVQPSDFTSEGWELKSPYSRPSADHVGLLGCRGDGEEIDLPPQGLGYEILAVDNLFWGLGWESVLKCEKGVYLENLTLPLQLVNRISLFVFPLLPAIIFASEGLSLNSPRLDCQNACQVTSKITDCFPVVSKQSSPRGILAFFYHISA
jgi:hypothetical protein